LAPSPFRGDGALIIQCLAPSPFRGDGALKSTYYTTNVII